ncbi:assembly protein in type IV pilin biogenesis transmembrane protein [Enterobacterales bacterium]|nr:assembly protein in type IV pilin biogenesis transmembrane protein [Enterobacterales bacterium]
MSQNPPIQPALSLYQWQAIDALGKLHIGELLASDESDVHQQLFSQFLQPVNVKKQFRLRAAYWKNPDRIALIRQFATLLQAGLPLVNSLMLLATEHSKAPWRCILQDIARGVKEGKPLSEMLTTYSDVFPQIYRHIISIGELTGQLDRCCLQLAIQQEQQAALRTKVKKALRYPLIVISIALIVTVLMLTMVLPEFAKIYASFDARLPWFTEMLMMASKALVSYGPVLAGLIAVLFALYIKIYHPQQRWRWREQSVLLRIPLLRKLVADSCLSQIFQTLAMTQQAGMTLLTGLDAAATTSTNLLFQRAVTGIREQLALGIPLHTAIGQSLLFPPLCQQLIRIGEESGSLDDILLKLAKWHNQQANELADTMSQSIEPILMVVMGILVGGLVIAMYLPIFQLGAVMG